MINKILLKNYCKLASKGIREGIRVSKNGLVNSGIVINDNNPKIDEINKIFKDNGYDFNIDLYTESNFYKLHKIDDSYKVDVKKVFEGIAEKGEYDMVPIEGERFANVINRTSSILRVISNSSMRKINDGINIYGMICISNYGIKNLYSQLHRKLGAIFIWNTWRN